MKNYKDKSKFRMLTILGYEVWRSAEPYFNTGEANTELMTTLGPPIVGNTLSFTDAGVVSSGIDYYYIIKSQTETSEAVSERKGLFHFNIYPGWNLLAWPLLPADTDLDAILGAQLYGTEDPQTANRVLVWEGTSQSYESAWFCGGPVCQTFGEPYYHHWLANDYTPSPLTLEPDTGFWLHNRSGITETVVIVGQVAEAARSVAVASDWQLLGSALPVSKALDEANIPATGTEDPQTADRILYWEAASQSYASAWFCGGPVCETFGEPYYNHWLANDYSLTPIVLEPGHGFWYQNRHDAFTWVNEVP